MRRYILLLIFVLSFCFVSSAQARKLALLVGVDDYENVPSLKCCVNDIKALKEALITVGFKEYDIQVFTTGSKVVRDMPTKKKIEQKVAEILAAAQDDDIVFFAFSGHGAREDKTDYFCPPFADPENLEGTCVSITKIMDDLSKCDAKFKWMVVDACRNNPNSRDAKAFQVIPTPPAGIALFQSCDRGEKSYEEKREGGHGYFTKNLVAALSGEADSNHDGKLTLLEVCSWTTSQTQAEVEKAENKTQRPFLNLSAADFTITVNVNVLEAKALVEEARKAVKAEDYKLALQKIDEAIALCPSSESLKREREYIKNLRPKFNPRSITVPVDFQTIEEAYENVQDGGIITIQPGKYELSATLEVNRPVTFRGSTGRSEDVVIDCPSSYTFKITSGSPSFQNLTVSSGATKYGCILITGGTPKLFRCIVTSRKAFGLGVYGEKANPQVDSCTFKNCGWNGVQVCEKGLGAFNDCDIYGNAFSGIEILKSGNPTVTGCKIHDGKDAGVHVLENGLGKFSDCEIYRNAKQGIEIRDSGNPIFTDCKIYDGKSCGVFVLENGLGKFSNCEIYGNVNSGIQVQTSGNPIVIRCKIHDGKDATGLYVLENGLGKFSDCDIYGNSASGVYVKTSGNPTVTGCIIHDGKEAGVWVHDKGMGTFNNNTLERNYTDGKLDNWHINSDAGTVNGSGNTPPIPTERR